MRALSLGASERLHQPWDQEVWQESRRGQLGSSSGGTGLWWSSPLPAYPGRGSALAGGLAEVSKRCCEPDDLESYPDCAVNSVPSLELALDLAGWVSS